MRTTIDIPDSLFRKIKGTAASEGRTLKDWILGAVNAKLRVGGSSDEGMRVKIPIVNSKEPSYDLSSERLAEILEEEDRELSS